MLILVLLTGSALFYGWPFEVRLPFRSVPNGATAGEGEALTFSSPGIVVDRTGGRLLYERLEDKTAISVVVAAETRGIDQTGPARLVTQSADQFARNFTIGQENDSFVFRIRTPVTGNNGQVSDLRARNAFRQGRPVLLVATYDGERVRLYADGQLADEAPLPDGAFSGWNPDYPLVFGNEATGTRPWLGRLHDVAIYDTALSPEQVATLSVPGPGPGSSHRIYDLRARCLSHESAVSPETGTVVLGSCRIPADLRVRYMSEMFTRKLRHPSDFAHALLVWLPIGIALRGVLVSSPGFAILLVGSWATLLEAMQLFVPARSSSILDLLAALAAGGAGCLLGGRLRGLLRGRSRP